MNLKTDGVLAGLIGHHIAASFAPEIHMREGQRQGLRYVYRLLDLSNIGVNEGQVGEFLTSMEKAGYNGLAVTHPFKQSVIPFLDELGEDARLLNAVNTVIFEDGRKIGHNTDWYGFQKAYHGSLSGVRNDRVVQIGAGGAGAAVAYAALHCGVSELVVFDLDVSRAKAVTERLGRHFPASRIRVGQKLEDELAEAAGIINASPVGMSAHPGFPVNPDLIRADHWVADIIYFPWETELLRRARRAGARTMNGGAMAVHQAAAQFKLFTGVDADVQSMLATVELLSAASIGTG